MEYRAEVHGRRKKNGIDMCLVIKPCCTLPDDLSEEEALAKAREAGEQLARDESALSEYQIVFSLYAIYRLEQNGTFRSWVPIWAAEAAGEAAASS